jgi:uncharacterized protein (TIGR03067 family)
MKGRTKPFTEGRTMKAKIMWVVVAVIAASLVGAAATRGADDAEKVKGKDDPKAAADLKKMQGTWTTPSSGGEDSVYTFKDDKLTVKAPSRTYKITVKLDAAAKPHKTLDMKIDSAPEDAKGKTVKAIYKLDGDDKLALCFRPEGERPEKFEQVGEEQFLIELKRKKE